MRARDPRPFVDLAISFEGEVLMSRGWGCVDHGSGRWNSARKSGRFDRRPFGSNLSPQGWKVVSSRPELPVVVHYTLCAVTATQAEGNDN
jgi:hypothetical protein